MKMGKEEFHVHEKISHGSQSFPVGIHKTIIPPNLSVGEGVRCQILNMHWHTEFEFFYLTSGNCTFIIDGVWYELLAGDAIFVPANAVHGAYRFSSSRATVFYAVVFSPYLLEDSGYVIYENYILPVLVGERIFVAVYRRKEPWQAEVLRLLLEILSFYDDLPYDRDPDSGRHPELCLRKDAICAEIIIKRNFLDIWHRCICHAGKGREYSQLERLNHERVQRAIEFMHAHYGEPISLKEIAASVFMSREYFARIFKACTNVSPFSYLTYYRISQSMELLLRSDLKVIEIAAMCGFSQVSCFNRKFSDIVQCTPTEYRLGRLPKKSEKEGNITEIGERKGDGFCPMEQAVNRAEV